MIVVADSSPVIALARVDQIGLLRGVYGEVLIPEAVRDELLAGESAGSLLAANPWLRAVALIDTRFLAQVVRAGLGAGEREAIALALELRADAVLIDDRRARAESERLGLSAVGVLGILLAAKRAGLITGVTSVIADLRERADFRLDDALVQRMLRTAGE